MKRAVIQVLILNLNKKLEKLFIAPKVRQELQDKRPKGLQTVKKARNRKKIRKYLWDILRFVWFVIPILDETA